MPIKDWSWNLFCKLLLAAGAWIVLWSISPIVATGFVIIASLCAIAYLHDDSKSQIANKDFTAEFKRRLALVEAKAGSGSLSNTTNSPDSFAEASYPQSGLEKRPLSVSMNYGAQQKGFSMRTLGRDSAIIAGAAVLFHVIHVPASAAMAFLLTAIFSVSRTSDWLTNVVSSGVGAVALSLLFFQPIWSFRVSQPMDRAALAIFILVPIAAYQLVNSKTMVRI